MQPIPPEQTRPKRRMPAQMTRQRRARRPRHRSQKRVVGLILLLTAALGFAGWKWIASRGPGETAAQDKRAKAALLTTINQLLAASTKDVPNADVVVNSAVFHIRDGQRYLSGTVHNRSGLSYPLLHLVFDTYDGRHNRAGEIEGDVTNLTPGEEAPFEIGPANPRARTCALQSIRAVK